VAAARLKPLVKTRRRPFLIKRQHAVLSRALEQALFDCADVLSEGSARSGPGSRVTYYGSTMISIAFARLAAEHGAKLTVAEQRELLRVAEGSVRVRLRAMRLARAEAARRVYSGVLGTAVCELRLRADAEQLHIDVDLEAEVRVSSRAKRS
jgi:hypothetical protein